MKLILAITSGTLSGRRFELSDGFITIGRSENSGIRFDPVTERIASKQHAFVEARTEGFFVTDNKSTNGTFVNGKRIETARLNSGDILQFGPGGITALIELRAELTIADTVQLESIEFGPTQVNPDVVAPTQFRDSVSGLVPDGNEAFQRRDKPIGKYIAAGIFIFAFVFLGLIVLGIMLLSLGPVAASIAAVVAFTPAIIYLIPLAWLDRFDPEPLWLLASAFAWGAVVAVFVSFIINTFLGLIFGDAFGAIVSAPIFEEGSKGLGLVILLVFFRKYFDGVLDGLIFAGVIALGFATVENVLYYGVALLEGGVPGVAVLFILRGILSPFAHVTFTAMIGIGCGVSRESHNLAVRLGMPLIGYLGAVLLHGLWNAVAVLGGLQGFIVIYIIMELPFFIIFVGFTFYIMHRQNKILKEMLAIDVARGLITQDHLDIATSAFRSFTWVWGGAAKGKYKLRRKFLRAVGKLGLSYWHIQRATAAHGQTGSFQQNPIHRDEVVKWREQI